LHPTGRNLTRQREQASDDEFALSGCDLSPMVGAVSPDEFAEFYAASFRRLVGQLYAMTGDSAEAQDAVQEAFVRGWANRAKLHASASPEAWVRSTAWRIAISRWHRTRRGWHLLRSQPPPQAESGPSPDRVTLVDALRKLPAEQRRAVVLYHLCDRTVAEIAAETGAPVGTVKARLARGRNALAAQLRDSAAATPGSGRGMTSA
jgi:RNA polymerase sigma-70 factor, ECF subfamily